MSSGAARGMEIVGAIIAVIGMVFWYTTPADVVVAPIIVVLVGLAVALVGWVVSKNQAKQSTDDLVEKVRAERERDGQ